MALAIAASFAAGCTHAEPPPEPTSTPLSGAPASDSAAPPATVVTDLKQLLPALAKADFVLVGERHDHPPQHQIQAQILQLWTTTGRRPAVAFEQLDTTQQPALDRFMTTQPRDASGLGAAVGWAKSGWPPWSTYRPIADIAVRAGLPIVAALVPKAKAMDVAARGFGAAFSAIEQHQLGLDHPESPAVDAALTDAITKGHCNLLPADAIPPMVRVQKARDAGMAERLAGAAADHRGGFLVTGNDHARKDMGVPRYLARLAPAAKILSIGLIERGSQLPVPGAYDMVYFTERLPEPDHCAELKKRFHKE